MEAFILGMIQGITEFLPISSSAHLLIANKIFNFQSEVINSNMFDAILHGGSILAIFMFFFKDIKRILHYPDILFKIFLSAIPTFLLGFLIEPVKDVYFRSVSISIFSLIFWGVYMIVAERRNNGLKTLENLRLKDFLVLGLMQSIALIPGTSRSGITIATALLLNMKREEAISTSFLMGLPVISAAFAYEFRKALIIESSLDSVTLISGLLSSLVFSLLALIFLVKFIRKFKFSSFAYYRFALALLLIVWFWKG
ncbi:MAG: undecaprenyl-diphosphate phosphatase [Proteobacteria bacterium]|nr:undecaprenyl-diphosphate phosphatase [Pseudomonadota bacterium]